MGAQGPLRAEESSPSPQGSKVPSLDSPSQRMLFLKGLSASSAQPHLRRAGEAGPKEGGLAPLDLACLASSGLQFLVAAPHFSLEIYLPIIGKVLVKLSTEYPVLPSQG